MKKMMWLGVIALIFTACSMMKKKPNEYGAADLNGTWQPVRVYSEANTGLKNTDLAGITMELDTKEMKITGKAPCNRYFGQFTLNGKSMKVAENMASTRMACDRLDAEGKYFKAVHMIRSYRFTGKDEVELLGEGEKCIFTLKKVAAK